MTKTISIHFNIVFRLAVVLFVASFICSCEKEELPVPAHTPGNVITNSVTMRADYRYQLFFDLGTNTMVSQNNKTDWDLGFESSTSGDKIILNSSKMMFVALTNQSNFNTVLDTIGLTFKWDAISGDLDSTAIGNWKNHNNIYVVDRGLDSQGAHLGFKKISFQSVNSNAYEIRFANLDGSDDVVRSVVKADTYNFMFLSLDNVDVIVEPEKNNWDLVFTQYTHVFQGNPPIPYLVTGVLINRNNVEILNISDKDFENITIEDINEYTFYSTINQIGYNWKEYVFSTGSYTIFSDKNYIIKSTEGKYYKLHFIDFYDSTGIKGTPTFEFQEL